MNTLLEITGISACVLVVARHSCRAITGSTLGQLVKVALKIMLDMTDDGLGYCVSWNTFQRDKYRARYNRATTARGRANAGRMCRQLQRNIDHLNHWRQQSDRLTGRTSK